MAALRDVADNFGQICVNLINSSYERFCLWSKLSCEFRCRVDLTHYNKDHHPLIPRRRRRWLNSRMTIEMEPTLLLQGCPQIHMGSSSNLDYPVQSLAALKSHHSHHRPSSSF